MNADATQPPLSLGAFLLLLGLVLAVAGGVLLVEKLAKRRPRDRRGEYVPPRMPRGRL
jgi:hypothetical protein